MVSAYRDLLSALTVNVSIKQRKTKQIKHTDELSLSRMADINPNAAKLLRTTEEIVAQARLDQIAKDHKSIGSILDTRAVQPLEEVRFQTKKAIKLDIEKRLQARRGGRAEYDILSATNLAVEKFKEQGINVDSLTGNYELEEQIWKEKTRKLAYSQRRRFQQPLLHEFSQKMNDKQRAEYREKVAGALVELAEKYRKECVELKTEFDSSGIFHPEANAHRAHCMYLIKLNKGISADTIEDPVLKSMFIEHLKEERFKGVELTAGQKAFLEDNDPELLAEKRRQQSLLENKLMMSLQRRSTRAKLKPLSTHSSSKFDLFYPLLRLSLSCRKPAKVEIPKIRKTKIGRRVRHEGQRQCRQCSPAEGEGGRR